MLEKYENIMKKLNKDQYNQEQLDYANEIAENLTSTKVTIEAKDNRIQFEREISSSKFLKYIILNDLTLAYFEMLENESCTFGTFPKQSADFIAEKLNYFN